MTPNCSEGRTRHRADGEQALTVDSQARIWQVNPLAEAIRRIRFPEAGTARFLRHVNVLQVDAAWTAPRGKGQKEYVRPEDDHAIEGEFEIKKIKKEENKNVPENKENKEKDKNKKQKKKKENKKQKKQNNKNNDDLFGKDNPSDDDDDGAATGPSGLQLRVV